MRPWRACCRRFATAPRSASAREARLVTLPAGFEAIAPLVYVIGLALAVIVVDIVRPGRDRTIALLTAVGLVVGMVVVLLAAGTDQQDAFGGAYRRDALTSFLDLLFLSIALLTVLFAPDYLRVR